MRPGRKPLTYGTSAADSEIMRSKGAMNTQWASSSYRRVEDCRGDTPTEGWHPTAKHRTGFNDQCNGAKRMTSELILPTS
jgi:hypothetical protein